jgi:hypothetical protein
LEYLTSLWHILRLFDTFCGHLVYFYHFGMLYLEKSGNPGRYASFLKNADFRNISGAAFVLHNTSV